MGRETVSGGCIVFMYCVMYVTLAGSAPWAPGDKYPDVSCHYMTNTLTSQLAPPRNLLNTIARSVTDDRAFQELGGDH